MFHLRIKDSTFLSFFFTVINPIEFITLATEHRRELLNFLKPIKFVELFLKHKLNHKFVCSR